MDHQEARAFLVAHQPVSNDFICESQEAFDAVGECIDFYEANPVQEDLKLLFGFMGEASECDWEDRMQALLTDEYPRDKVIEHLIDVFERSDHVGRTIWAAYLTWALEPSEQMTICRKTFAHTNEDARCTLAYAIAFSATCVDMDWVRELAITDDSEEVRENLNEALDGISERNAAYATALAEHAKRANMDGSSDDSQPKQHTSKKRHPNVTQVITTDKLNARRSLELLSSSPELPTLLLEYLLTAQCHRNEAGRILCFFFNGRHNIESDLFVRTLLTGFQWDDISVQNYAASVASGTIIQSKSLASPLAPEVMLALREALNELVNSRELGDDLRPIVFTALNI